MQLKQVIETLKTQKFALIMLISIFLVFILVVATFANDLIRDSRVQDPNITNRNNGGINGNERPLNLVSMHPPSGERAILDSFEIVTFEFAEPIVYDTFAYRSKPPILLKVLEDPSHPNVLALLPEGDGWLPNTAYTVTIITVGGISGATIPNPITYTYLNNPPDTMKMNFPY